VISELPLQVAEERLRLPDGWTAGARFMSNFRSRLGVLDLAAEALSPDSGSRRVTPKEEIAMGNVGSEQAPERTARSKAAEIAQL